MKVEEAVEEVEAEVAEPVKEEAVEPVLAVRSKSEISRLITENKLKSNEIDQ